MEGSRVQQILLLLSVIIIFMISGYYKFYKQFSSAVWIKFNPDPLQERLSRAESVWTEQVLKRKQTSEPYNDTSRIVWEFYYPTFTCPYLVERIGKIGDGGKWVCGLSEISRSRQQHGCVVYSYGISTDTSFEEEILQRTNCTVYGYDHTVDLSQVSARMAKNYQNRTTFRPFGIGVKDEGRFRTLRTEMKRNGHEFIDILKVDVEGAEAMVFPQIVQGFNGILPFSQLLIEIHLGAKWGLKTKNGLKEWWDMLEGAGLRPFNKEPNLYPNEMCCFEFSFLNVKMGHFAMKEHIGVATTTSSPRATNRIQY